MPVNPGSQRSRGRPALPVDRILAVALEILDEQGADALSMRSLAQRLESGTATLYRHFANRSELVAMLVERVLGEIDIDAQAVAELPWRQACMLFAQQMFEALGRHGNVAPLLIGHVPIGPNALAGREICLSVLLDNGFAPSVAAHAYATLARYVLGFAIQLSGSTSATAEGDAEAVGRVPSSRPVALSRDGGRRRRTSGAAGGGVRIRFAAHRRRTGAIAGFNASRGPMSIQTCWRSP